MSVAQIQFQPSHKPNPHIQVNSLSPFLWSDYLAGFQDFADSACVEMEGAVVMAAGSASRSKAKAKAKARVRDKEQENSPGYLGLL